VTDTVSPGDCADFDDCPIIVIGLNAYLTLDDAEELAATRLFTEPWSSVNARTREQAIITATALLHGARWQGRKLAPTQPLAWPRVAERAPLGYPITTEVPQAIKTASVELAIHLLATGTLGGGAPIMQRMLGDSMEMFYPTVADEWPKHVRRLIEPYLRASSANVAEVHF